MDQPSGPFNFHTPEDLYEICNKTEEDHRCVALTPSVLTFTIIPFNRKGVLVVPTEPTLYYNVVLV